MLACSTPCVPALRPTVPSCSLMMGTLGLGSVSESVLRYAPCTVAVHKLASGLSK